MARFKTETRVIHSAEIQYFIVPDDGQDISSKAVLGLLTDIPVILPPPNHGAYKGLIERISARTNLATKWKE